MKVTDDDLAELEMDGSGFNDENRTDGRSQEAAIAGARCISALGRTVSYRCRGKLSCSGEALPRERLEENWVLALEAAMAIAACLYVGQSSLRADSWLARYEARAEAISTSAIRGGGTGGLAHAAERMTWTSRQGRSLRYILTIQGGGSSQSPQSQCRTGIPHRAAVERGRETVMNLENIFE